MLGCWHAIFLSFKGGFCLSPQKGSIRDHALTRPNRRVDKIWGQIWSGKTAGKNACFILSNLTISCYDTSDFMDQDGFEGLSGVPGSRTGADDHGAADSRARRKSR